MVEYEWHSFTLEKTHQELQHLFARGIPKARARSHRRRHSTPIFGLVARVKSTARYEYRPQFWPRELLL